MENRKLTAEGFRAKHVIKGEGVPALGSLACGGLKL